MKRITTFFVSGLVLLMSWGVGADEAAKDSNKDSAQTTSQSAVAAPVPTKLATKLTPGEITREQFDTKQYPNFMKFLSTVNIQLGLNPSDPRNAAHIKTSQVFTPTLQMWRDFFKAAAADHLTCLRAFGLLARKMKKEGVVVFGPGVTFEKAVQMDNVDLGLALPAKNIGTAVWSPDPSNTDPEFQAHIKVFYTESYTHQFPDEILPANLKIGQGEEQTYWMGGKEYKQPTIEADIYYGMNKGVGFKNVKGIGGQKRGVLGFFQKVLFFLPDAVHSMAIDEKKGAMVTEALINTTIEDFEKNPIYSIKINVPQKADVATNH